MIGYFDAYGRFSWNALDQNRFGAQRQAQVIRQPGDAAVFDAGFRFEFVGRHHRSGIDLRDVSTHVKFAALLFDGFRAFFQLVFLNLFAALRQTEQARRRQTESCGAARNLRLAGRLLHWS